MVKRLECLGAVKVLVLVLLDDEEEEDIDEESHFVRNLVKFIWFFLGKNKLWVCEK